MTDDDINNYVPSILNPKKYKKNDFGGILSQNSVLTRRLSLKKSIGKTNNSSRNRIEDKENSQNLTTNCSTKRSVVNVDFDIETKMLSSEDDRENFLFLKTNDTDRLSHVTVQSSSNNIIKKSNSNNSKFISKRNSFQSIINDEKFRSQPYTLRQKTIFEYFKGKNVVKSKFKNKSVDKPHINGDVCVAVGEISNIKRDETQEMNKNSGVADNTKLDRIARVAHASNWKETDRSAKSAKLCKRNESPKSDIKNTNETGGRTISPKRKNATWTSPRRNSDSAQSPVLVRSNKSSPSQQHIPYFKIVAGTHFAVDAFSYGDIPNVKHYFLTHFHSDHYSGLKRTFCKVLHCTKITADLCMSRLGVNAKYINIINTNETILIEGVEVTVVDANHCPGAVMLVFTLPSRKTILHTGDFRATPTMESYPIFWNMDIHTVYLDTTYCNPRYDFPTQDQSLEMALHLLRQKKASLEKINKKFSSVLIVCGTYTIGKEKFFLGIARRVGCSVWACPDKDKILQIVEGRSFSQTPPQNCQLHIVPMRDLNYEKLRSYLDGLKGAFSEVVAFKPSGWENGKNSTVVEKDCVTIHGIPYSEHSSFSELIRFVKYLKPKQVVPTVDIAGGVKSVQKYFPCPLVSKEEPSGQSRLTNYFSIQNNEQVSAVT